MRILHIVGRAGDDDSVLERCWASLNPGDALLLLDGARVTAERLAIAAALGVAVYALQADRPGVSREARDAVEVIDFSRFVDLTAEYDASLSWG